MKSLILTSDFWAKSSEIKYLIFYIFDHFNMFNTSENIYFMNTDIHMK